MRFVVDAQLPPGLARFLAARGHQAEHVIDIGLGSADDTTIWNYAAANAATVVTKDEDFAIRISIAVPGPSIVWLRVGNTSNRALMEWFAPLLPSIEAALAEGERLVEVA